MKNEEVTLWGIHAGRTGAAHSLFLKHNCVALGWLKMGDLSKLEKNREAFKAKLAEAYPDTKPGAIPVKAGQLYRFLYVMKIGDIVLYPSKSERQIHIGKVTGEYKYGPSKEQSYPNQRQVKWIGNYPRTRFSQGALYEIGAAMSFFQVRNYAEEYLVALQGKAQAPDDTVTPVAEDIEETTRDYILKRLAQELKGLPFEDFIAHLLNAMGYRTRMQPEGKHGGVDIIAHKDELGFEPPIIKIQVKSGEGNITPTEVSAFLGNVAPSEYGLFITLGTFNGQALNNAKGKSNLRLIDGNELVELVLQHYDQFDSRYQGLLPLKRVYVPEPIEETGE